MELKMDNFYENFIENDLNPFILFNNRGKVIKFNKEADFLLSFVPTKEIFNLAMSNASNSYGYKKSFISLNFANIKFYAILVGYIDEDSIGIKLYKEVSTDSILVIQDKLKSVNLFTLLELSKNSTLSSKNIRYIEEFDPSIPDIRVDIDAFLKLINSIFSKFENSKEIKIKVALKIGDNIYINGKKYSICFIEFKGIFAFKDKYILELEAKKANCSILFKEFSIQIEFPLIF